MFSSHKQLIRTPVKSDEKPKAAEFTPIGTGNKNIGLLNREAASKSTQQDNLDSDSTFTSIANDDGTSSSFAFLGDGPNHSRIYRGTDIFSDGSSRDENTSLDDTLHDDTSNLTRAELVGDRATLVKKQSSELQRLRSDNFNLRVELVSLKKSLQGLPHDKKDLISRNVKLSKELAHLEEEISKIKQGKKQEPHKNDGEIEKIQNAYESKVNELEDRLSDAKRDLDVMQKTKEEFESNNQNLENKVSDMKWQLEDMKAQLDHKSDTSIDKEDRISELEIELTNAEEEADSVKKVNHKLEHELNEMKQKLNDAQDEIKHPSTINHEDKLNDQLRKLSQENDELKHTIEKDSRKIDTLSKKLKDTEAETSDVKLRNQELVHSIDALKQHKEEVADILRNEVKNVYSKANKTVEEKDSLRHKLNEMQKALEKAQEHYKDDYVKDIEADRQDLYDNLKKLSQRYQSLQDEMDNLREELIQKDSHIKKLTSHEDVNDHTELYLEKARAELEKLQLSRENEKKKHREELDAISDQYQNKETDLLNAISDLRDQKSELVEEYEGLQRKFNTLKNEHVINPDNYDKLQHDFMRLSEEYGKLSSQNELLAEEYSTYKDNSRVMEKQLRRDIEFKSDEIKKLREELSSSISKSEADRLRDSIKIAEKEAKNFAEERNKLEKDNDDLRVKIEDLRISKNSFQRRLELLHSKNLETESEMNELERLRDQISEVSTENKSLKSSLKKSTDELEEHKERLERLIQEKKLLAKSMNELESNQKSAMIKNEKLQDDLKMARNLQKSSKSVLQEKIQDKNEEIKKLINDYNNMKNELLDRFGKERANKKQIEQNLEEATDKLQMLKVREGMLLQEEEKLQEQLNKSKRIKSARVEKDYPPTPRTPTHDSNQNNIDIPLMEARVNLLESQRDLYRLKLQDLKNLAADLKFANEYLERELRSKNVTIDKNVSLLKATLEQKPDELDRNATKLSLFSRKSRTFAGGALAVLAIIRLKHRLEARKRRKIQERFIKDRILQQQRDL